MKKCSECDKPARSFTRKEGRNLGWKFRKHHYLCDACLRASLDRNSAVEHNRYTPHVIPELEPLSSRFISILPLFDAGASYEQMLKWLMMRKLNMHEEAARYRNNLIGNHLRNTRGCKQEEKGITRKK